MIVGMAMISAKIPAPIPADPAGSCAQAIDGMSKPTIKQQMGRSFFMDGTIAKT